MIIVSQDKVEMINFNKITSIYYSVGTEGRTTLYANVDGNVDLDKDIELGIYYGGFERAKEILREIAIMHSKFETAKYTANYLRTQPLDIVKAMPYSETKVKYFDVFEMPKA